MNKKVANIKIIDYKHIDSLGYISYLKKYSVRVNPYDLVVYHINFGTLAEAMEIALSMNLGTNWTQNPDI